MDGIVGNNDIIKNLRRAEESDQVSHGYIFDGDEGVGKLMLAKYFSQLLQCTGKRKPCGECHSCVQCESGNHPDIIFVTHEKPGLIGVDDVRVGINQNMIIKPYEGPYKIYIVDEAEKMSIQAQNALLKTIEEPPAYGIIILLTTNANTFLDTIRSRMVQIHVKPLSPNQIQTYLMDHGYDSLKSEKISRFAGGSIGKAMKMAASEDFNSMYEVILHVLRSLQKLDTAGMLTFVGEMSQYKLQVNECLDFIQLWLRDVLVYKATADLNGVIFREEYSAIRQISEHTTYAGLEQMIQAVDDAKRRLEANVNYELSLELLIMTIHDNIK